MGAEGAFSDREKAASFNEFSLGLVQLVTAAAQMGVPVPVNWEALAIEFAERHGINNPSKFIGALPAIAGGAAAEQSIPGIAGGDPAMAAATGSPMEAPIEGPAGPTIQ
jgi:hypothetical protein